MPLRERTLPIADFFVAYRKTALQTGEILKAIIVPRGISKPGLARKCSWFKVSRRREMDISTVAACFTVDLDKQNVVRHARLAYGGVAAMPSRAKKTESALLGKVWSKETIENVLPILRTEFTPISDVRGSADYRSGLVTSLLGKFFAGENQRMPEQKIISMPAPANRPPPHESGHKHVTGEAIYTDDPPAGKNFLEVWPVCAPHARARILSATRPAPARARHESRAARRGYSRTQRRRHQARRSPAGGQGGFISRPHGRAHRRRNAGSVPRGGGKSGCSI